MRRVGEGGGSVGAVVSVCEGECVGGVGSM